MVYLILALILSMGSVYAGPPLPSNGPREPKPPKKAAYYV